MRIRDGFTLIELLIALVVSGIAVSVAAGVFTNATDALTGMARRARLVEREAAGILWLQDGLLGTDVGTEPDARFRGAPESLRFSTILPTPYGWTEPVVLTAGLEGGRLVVRAGREALPLPDSLDSVAFDYLAEYGAESAWLQRFESATDAPLAVRLRRRRADGVADTTLFHLGRGR
jgi:prepilin-type N-terminal cleavage/methylation domain-containing protein